MPYTEEASESYKTSSSIRSSSATNAQISAIFSEIADLLSIENANPFRVRAYRNAARLVSASQESMAELLNQDKDLSELPGIGDDLAGKIEEIVATGKSKQLAELHSSKPRSLLELLKIQGLGPKRVSTLYNELDIKGVEELCEAAGEGRVADLPGFGKKLQDQILQAARSRMKKDRRFKHQFAEAHANALLSYLNEKTSAQKLIIAGSYRRRKETVGDLDIILCADNGKSVIENFTNYKQTENVISKGSTRASIILDCGLQVDLRVVPLESYGAALLYFTGSKAHNVALRRIAQKQGLKLNEYGLYEGNSKIAGGTEESIYKALGLEYICPELREKQGEIEASRKGNLPELVEADDITGDLHCHTRETDGQNTLEEMVAAAKKKGYQYIAVTDHSSNLQVAGGLDEKRLSAQIKKIDELNKRLYGFRVLKSIEVDILEDGSLDLADEILSKLDLVVASIHSKFKLSKSKQTKRLLQAMENKCLTIIAHPTGRLIGKREPYEIDMQAIIQKAARQGVFLELNAHPERLDLNDLHCRMAKEAKVLVAISSDAHSIVELDLIAHGIGQARRGWLERDDVLNTRDLEDLKNLLNQRQR